MRTPPLCAETLRTWIPIAFLTAAAASAQTVVHSTHDWPNNATGSVGTIDRAMDCKTPGDGLTYIVGTTFTSNTNPAVAPALFSNAPISGPSPFVVGGRQVAYLQIRGANDAIVQQRYFYGSTSGQPGTGGFSTVARAIAVFPAPSAGDVRIAICGETYDRVLPSAVTPPNPHTNTQTGFSPCSGFLAVYDGNAALLWSYQFYGADVNATTMLTDLSIRVEGGVDLVTYCGNSTNGAYQGTSGVTSTMPPRLPFAAPPALVGCTDVPADGSTHNAPTPQTTTSQWDGFVGRLSMPHAGPFTLTTATLVFHSLVGGDFQDSLFGLHEIDANRFVVVGSTRNLPSQFGLPTVVPLWRPTPFNSTQAFCFNGTFPQFNCFGTVFWFDATPTRTGNNLLLTDSTLIGSPTTASVARDVTGTSERTWIIGSTNDPTFCTLDPNPIDGTLNDGVASAAMDGFVLTHRSDTTKFDHASYLGGQDNDAMTGIGQWNEYPDHVAILGWTEKFGQSDFVVHSIFFNGITSGQPSLPPSLRLLRTVVHGGSDDEYSANTQQLTTAGIISSNVGALEGGGIAVDSRGRVTLVGSTGSLDFPFDPSNPMERGPQPGRVATTPDTDAVTARIDWLPDGVCRTDGTGACNPIWTPAATYLGDGGTTPTCATAQFGALIGISPELRRMHIDFEGQPQAGASTYVLLDRPTTGSLLQGSVMQMAFASASPIVIDGIEKWMNDSTAVSQLYFTNSTSLRVPLGQLPSGSNTFAIQFVCFLPSAVCSTPNFLLGASPALMFSY